MQNTQSAQPLPPVADPPVPEPEPEPKNVIDFFSPNEYFSMSAEADLQDIALSRARVIEANASLPLSQAAAGREIRRWGVSYRLGVDAEVSKAKSELENVAWWVG